MKKVFGHILVTQIPFLAARFKGADIRQITMKHLPSYLSGRNYYTARTCRQVTKFSLKVESWIITANTNFHLLKYLTVCIPNIVNAWNMKYFFPVCLNLSHLPKRRFEFTKQPASVTFPDVIFCRKHFLFWKVMQFLPSTLRREISNNYTIKGQRPFLQSYWEWCYKMPLTNSDCKQNIYLPFCSLS